MDMLNTQQILDAELEDWRKLGQAFHARFVTGDLAAGLRFASAIEQAVDHYPDVKLTDSVVEFTLISHDADYRPESGPEIQVSWVTQRDVDTARQISQIATEQGVPADPGSLTTIELALDTADAAAISPFWAALLTGDSAASPLGDVRDLAGRVPVLWFQDTEAHEAPRQRFHLDVWLPHDHADARIAAAVAAGGRVVDDSEAPSFVVLADADGNKACVCTFLPAKA